MFRVYHIDLSYGRYTRHDSVRSMADVRLIIESERRDHDDRDADEIRLRTSWGAGPMTNRLHRQKETV